jgi:hypothetical protein
VFVLPRRVGARPRVCARARVGGRRPHVRPVEPATRPQRQVPPGLGSRLPCVQSPRVRRRLVLQALLPGIAASSFRVRATRRSRGTSTPTRTPSTSPGAGSASRWSWSPRAGGGRDYKWLASDLTWSSDARTVIVTVRRGVRRCPALWRDPVAISSRDLVNARRTRATSQAEDLGPRVVSGSATAGAARAECGSCRGSRRRRIRPRRRSTSSSPRRARASG